MTQVYILEPGLLVADAQHTAAEFEGEDGWDAVLLLGDGQGGGERGGTVPPLRPPPAPLKARAWMPLAGDFPGVWWLDAVVRTVEAWRRPGWRVLVTGTPVAVTLLGCAHLIKNRGLSAVASFQHLRQVFPLADQGDHATGLAQYADHLNGRPIPGQGGLQYAPRVAAPVLPGLQLTRTRENIMSQDNATPQEKKVAGEAKVVMPPVTEPGVQVPASTPSGVGVAGETPSPAPAQAPGVPGSAIYPGTVPTRSREETGGVVTTGHSQPAGALPGQVPAHPGHQLPVTDTTTPAMQPHPIPTGPGPEVGARSAPPPPNPASQSTPSGPAPAPVGQVPPPAPATSSEDKNATTP